MAPDASWATRARYLAALSVLRQEVLREMDRAQVDDPSESALMTAWSQVVPLYAARCRPTVYRLFE